MSLNLDKSAWKRVTFGDVVCNANNSVRDPASSGIDRLIGMEHLDPGDLKIKRWGSLKDGITFTRRVSPGQTLFGKRRAYQRKVAYAEFDAICSGDILTFKADEAQLLPEFLPFLVQSNKFFDHALSTSAGSLSPRTNWRDLSTFEFDLPPLEEQKRIASLLWAVEKHRIALCDLSLKLGSSLTAAITDFWLSTDQRAIADIGRCITGSTPSKANQAYWDSEDVPFYTPTEIGERETIREARQKVSKTGAVAGRLLPANSVAVACIGGDMGKSAVVQLPGISNQQITSVVGLADDDAYTLQALLAHPFGRAGMAARETTTIVRKLNKSDLMKVQVPWPEDREDIHSLVLCHRRAASLVETEAAALGTLRSSMLTQIFGGS